MPTKWYEGEVMSIQKLSPSVKQFFVRVRSDEKFDFLPGQFVTMDLPLGEKRLDRWRSYSIANEANSSNLLEFCIVRFDDGLGSCFFHDVLKVGDFLKFKGPEGGFILPEKITQPIIMIATGTGIAPFRSMIRSLISRQIFFPSIHLVFGARKEEDILYLEEMTNLALENPHFRFSVALSREDKPGFTRGYVHEVYMNPNFIMPSDVLVYICGWSRMIDQAVELLLLEKKLDKSQIRYELYG